MGSGRGECSQRSKTSSGDFSSWLFSCASRTKLDPIVAPGSDFTQAFDINDSGQIVGTYQVAGNAVDLAYLLSGGTFTEINVGSATGINDLGQIAGQSGNDGFLLSRGVYSTIDVPGSTFTQPTGINDAAQIVGVYGFVYGPSPNYSFLLSSGIFSTLNVPSSTYTQANGINNSGEIVGYYSRGGLFHGFRLNSGGYTTLDFPGATFTRAYGIRCGPHRGRLRGRRRFAPRISTKRRQLHCD